MSEEFRERRRNTEKFLPTKALVDTLEELVTHHEDFAEFANNYIDEEYENLKPDEAESSDHLEECKIAIANLRQKISDAKSVLAGKHGPDSEIRANVSEATQELAKAFRVAQGLISPDAS